MLDLMLRRVLVLSLIACPAAAAEVRTPTQQDTLAELAKALGRAHALHRLCAGPADGRWYGRMERMIAVERPTPALKRRLVESFNAGFGEASGAFPKCSDASQGALRDAAERGRTLSAGLAGP